MEERQQRSFNHKQDAGIKKKFENDSLATSDESLDHIDVVLPPLNFTQNNDKPKFTVYQIENKTEKKNKTNTNSQLKINITRPVINPQRPQTVPVRSVNVLNKLYIPKRPISAPRRSVKNINRPIQYPARPIKVVSRPNQYSARPSKVAGRPTQNSINSKKVFNKAEFRKRKHKKWTNTGLRKKVEKLKARNYPLKKQYFETSPRQLNKNFRPKRQPKKLAVKPPIFPPKKYKNISKDIRKYNAKYRKTPFSNIKTPYSNKSPVSHIQRPHGKPPKTATQKTIRLPFLQEPLKSPKSSIKRPSKSPPSSTTSTESNVKDKPYDVTRDVLHYIPSPDLSGLKPPPGFNPTKLGVEADFNAIDDFPSVEINSIDNDFVKELLEDEDIDDIFTKKRDTKSVIEANVEDNGYVIDLVGSNSFFNIPTNNIYRSESVNNFDRLDDGAIKFIGDEVVEYVEPLDTLQMALLQIDEDRRNSIEDNNETSIDVVIDFLEKKDYSSNQKVSIFF